jgi:hypothetical protein
VLSTLRKKIAPQPETEQLREALRAARAAVPTADAAVAAAKTKLQKVAELTRSAGIAAVELRAAERAAERAEDDWAVNGGTGEPDPAAFVQLQSARLAAARARTQAQVAGAAEEELADAEAATQEAIDTWAANGGTGELPAKILERVRVARLNVSRHRMRHETGTAAEREFERAESNLRNARAEHRASAERLVHAIAAPEIKQILADAQALRERYLHLVALASPEMREAFAAIGWRVGAHVAEEMLRICYIPSAELRRLIQQHRDAHLALPPEWSKKIERLMQDPDTQL